MESAIRPPCYTYMLLTKCAVTMAGYQSSSFLVFLWTKTKPRSIKMQKKKKEKKKKKKKEANIHLDMTRGHLDLTSLVNKGFLICPKDYTKEYHFCRNKAGNPEWARWVHLVHSGSQSEHRIHCSWSHS